VDEHRPGQECVAGGGAFLECAFAGKAGKNCIECLFQKKKWKVDSNSCE
jgi:hypothetical protein